EIARGTLSPRRGGPGEDDTRTNLLMHLLEQKVRAIRFPRGTEGDQFPALGPLHDRIGNIVRRHEHVRWRFSADRLASPGIELLSIEKTFSDLNREHFIIPTDSEEARQRASLEYMNQMFTEVAAFGRNIQTVREALVSEGELTEDQAKQIKKPAKLLR